MVHIAIIGGTGVYDPSILKNVYDDKMNTPYGEVAYKIGEFGDKKIAFIPRHGSHHSIPPHLINYRANIWAIKKLGVGHIIATTAVGSLNERMKPGDFVLVDQFLDFTKNRVSTFYEGGDRGVVHLDVTEPYCPKLRSFIEQAAQQLNLPIHNGGVYVCTDGPRFETPAEIKMFKQLGGDLVGMTNVPEVVLANEAEMCYSTISMVTNFAAGISPQVLTHAEVLEIMAENGEKLKKLIMRSIENINIKDDSCKCRKMLAEYGGFKL